MRKFDIGGGLCIKDAISVEEIYGGNKQRHLRRIAERTGVALSDMLFLDNERGNCVSVSEIGVTVAYTPDGVTAEAWQHALTEFPAPGEIVSC